jgi:hypothetical protein
MTQEPARGTLAATRGRRASTILTKLTDSRGLLAATESWRKLGGRSAGRLQGPFEGSRPSWSPKPLASPAGSNPEQRRGPSSPPPR